MNRAQKRAFIKEAKKKGISKEAALAYLAAQDAGLDITKPDNPIHDRDKVKVDVEKIKEKSDYDKSSDLYKEFIESYNDEIYTARLKSTNLIYLEEKPEWLFWFGDLILVESIEGELVDD